MEKGTAVLVAERASDETIRELEACYQTMERCKDDGKAFAVADLDFHLFLAKATGNPLIIKVTDIIRNILAASMENIVSALGVEDGLYYHEKIIEAVRARDPDLFGARRDAKPGKTAKTARPKKRGG